MGRLIDKAKLLEKASKKLTEDEFEAIAGKNYELGKVTGWRDGAVLLLEMATDSFQHTDDNKRALFLKELAKSFERKSDSLRIEYDAKWKMRSWTDAIPQGIKVVSSKFKEVKPDEKKS